VKVLRAHEQRHIGASAMHMGLAAPPAFGGQIGDPRQLLLDSNHFAGLCGELFPRRTPLRPTLNGIAKLALADHQLRRAIADEVVFPKQQRRGLRTHRRIRCVVEMHAGWQRCAIRSGDTDADSGHILGKDGTGEKETKQRTFHGGRCSGAALTHAMRMIRSGTGVVDRSRGVQARETRALGVQCRTRVSTRRGGD
jgi:hypothetical protein